MPRPRPAKRTLVFRNPANGYHEDCRGGWLWALLFGPFYLGFKGLWGWAFLGVVLSLLSMGFFWLVLPFCSGSLIRRAYRQRGWLEVDPPASMR